MLTGINTLATEISNGVKIGKEEYVKQTLYGCKGNIPHAGEGKLLFYFVIYICFIKWWIKYSIVIIINNI